MSTAFGLASIFLFPGYNVQDGDQAFYLPPLQQSIDPELYSRDFLMASSQTQASLFDELVGLTMLGKAENMYSAIFFWSLFSRALFFAAIILMALWISSGNKRFALLMPLVFIIIHKISVCNALPPESWIFSFGMELHARSLAISFTAFALTLYFWQKHRWAWVMVTGALLVHVISALPVVTMMGAHWLYYRIIKANDHFAALWYLLPLAALIVLLAGSSGEGGMTLFARIDPEWAAIMKERTSWVFLQEHFFSPPVLLGIYLPLALLIMLAIVSQSTSKKIKEYTAWLATTVTALAAVSVVGFSLFELAIFNQLQLYRGLIWIQIVLLIVIWHAVAANLNAQNSKPASLVMVSGLTAVSLGGSHFFLPLTVVLILAMAVIMMKKNWRPQNKKVFIPFLVLGTTILVAYAWHPLFNSQVALFRTFLESFISDPILTLGLVIEWSKRPLMLLIILAAMILPWPKEVHLGKGRRAAIVSGGILIFLTTLLAAGSWDKYRSYTASPIENASGMRKWILENVQKDELIFATLKTESLGVNIRNNLGKSLFVSRVEGAQGAFGREYALEWQKRRQLQADPEQYWQELKDEYGIDYVLAGADEDFGQAVEVFRDESHVLYKVE